MTKNTPKKSTQPKSAAAKKAEPMDATVTERAVGESAKNHRRTCHAIKQLVAEVAELFPETPVEYSAYDGRNTALGVAFDMSSMDTEEAILLGQLLGLVDSDERVEEVIVEDRQTLVLFRSSPRTQDNREPFGMADTYEVLTEGDLGYDVEWQPTGWIGGSL